MTDDLQEYTPPEWAKSLTNVPRYRVKLAMPDTPIHKWTLPGVPDDFQIYIKRDDMTGSALSGNKVRKLEFLLADAISSGCRHFITCGCIQSNYCRAVAVSAAQLGLTSHLVLRDDIKHPDELSCDGNVLINRLCGAQLYIAPDETPYETQILPRMERIADHIKRETGEKSYVAATGGSDAVGFYGYLEAFRELMSQGVHERFDDVVVTTGSGGTCEGMAAANYLTGSKVKVHGLAICDDASKFYNHGNSTLRQVGLNVRAEDIFDVIEGYKGQGYAIAAQEDYEFIQMVARTTGVILDPTYTGKAARGLIQEIQKNPDRFRGRRVLFVHTGGIFGTYDGRMSDVVAQTGNVNISMWNDLDQPPFE